MNRASWPASPSWHCAPVILSAKLIGQVGSTLRKRASGIGTANECVKLSDLGTLYIESYGS